MNTRVCGSMIDEQFSCRREPTNWENKFAVVISRDTIIVGHVREIVLSICCAPEADWKRCEWIIESTHLTP